MANTMNHTKTRIVIHTAPPRALLSNHRRRSHWRVQSEASQELKWEALDAMTEPPRSPLTHYRIDITVVWGKDDYPSETKLPDLDNLPPAVKPAIDMLQQQGYIVNDRFCQEYTIRQQLGDTGRIILELEAA